MVAVYLFNLYVDELKFAILICRQHDSFVCLWNGVVDVTLTVVVPANGNFYVITHKDVVSEPFRNVRYKIVLKINNYDWIN